MVFSVSSLMVILLRIMQGSGAALIFGTSVAILTEVTPVTERGKALGIYTTAVYLGLSLGPFVGGFLTTHFGWRSIFLVNLPIGLFAISLIALYLKGEWADSKGERFDLGGAIQYGLTLVCVMYGFSLLPDREGFILIVAGSVMLGVFILRELRIAYPLLNMKLFRTNRVFTYSSLAALINYAATASITFFLSLYLQYIRGFPASYAGTILVIQPVMMALFSPWAGRLSDRIEPAKIASTGMAILAVGLFLLTMLGPDTPLVFLAANPRTPRLRVCPLLFAQCQRDHEFCREKISRHCIRDPRHHAACRPDALDGHRDDDHRTLRRAGPDHSRPVRPAADGTKIGFAVFAALAVIGIFFSPEPGEPPRRETDVLQPGLKK